MKRIKDGAIGDIVVGPLLLEPGRPLDQAAPGRVERPRVADAQLALLHLALRRPHRGAARPQPRRHELGGGHPSRERPRHGRPPGAHRPRLRPHLRPLRHRLRVRQRRAPHEHVPPDRRLRQGHHGGRRRHQGQGRAERRRQAAGASPGPTPGSSTARPTCPTARSTPTSSPASAPGQPDERAEAGGREHADRDHGPHVGVHGQARHLGRGPRIRRGARCRRSWPSAPCPCPRWRNRGRERRSAVLAVAAVLAADTRAHGAPATRPRGGSLRVRGGAHGHDWPGSCCTPRAAPRPRPPRRRPSPASASWTRGSATIAPTARCRCSERAPAAPPVAVSPDLFAVLRRAARRSRAAATAPST